MDSHESSVEIRNHIGYVPGDLTMYPNLTGKDTLTYFANLRGGVDWGHVDTLAERLGVETRVASSFEVLSVKPGAAEAENLQHMGPMMMLAVGLALRDAA